MRTPARTWEHGQSPLNLLVLGVVVYGYTIPLVWIALDHTGNSDTRARIWLVLRLLKVFPACRWKGLVADREFTLQDWFRFLRRKGIKRAIRIKKDTLLDELHASEWFADLQVGAFRELMDRTAVYGEIMRVVATRSPWGDLVIIATDFSVWDTFALYRLRWPVECTFGSIKSRGFDLDLLGHHTPRAARTPLRSRDPGLAELPADGGLARRGQTDQGARTRPEGRGLRATRL